MIIEKKELNPGSGWGSGCFVTYEEYKKWAKENGDIFKLELNVTLHFSDQSGWTNKW